MHQVPMKISVVTSPGLTSDRQMEALLSTPKHFTEEHVRRAKVATGITMEYMLETNADAHSPACRHLPEERLVLIMGFLQLKELWGPVIDMLMRKWDAKKQGRNLKILTFDNRGVGGTDAPLGRYTTSQMADDATSLLDHLGWESANFVGHQVRFDIDVIHTARCMGGMIAIELACSFPERVQSLSLLVSTRGRYVPDIRSMVPLLGAIFSPTQRGVVKNTVSLNYPSDFLDRPIGDKDSEHYATLPNRHKPAGYKALVCQGMAVQTHYVSDERLEVIAKAGFPVLVVGNDFRATKVRALFFKNGGHGIDTQFAEEVADGLVKTLKRARLLSTSR
ncbi:alpha/beta hydrolase fold [Phytophthora infestans]|uniref:Alpha/beta hydrolase fold n=1 Tax=Phytophthora infestans TaxID=4787 RepID=A0A833TE83_PHYIN|nr:alpha/beta hydrolase fold [Phytophthora infestans]